MKKLYIILLFFVIHGWNVNAQAPAWLWAKSAGGTDTDLSGGICTDARGNVMITGIFSADTITIGSTVLTRNDLYEYDIFIVKYDAWGNVLWAKSAGGNSFDESQGISTDQNGDVLVTGEFHSDSIAFGTTVLTNAGDNDMFVVKFDAIGNVLWAKSTGGTDREAGQSICTGANGSVLVAGEFYGDSITFGTTVLTNTNAGTPDMFLVKYDASGNVLWAKSEGGNDHEFDFSISADASGNVLVTGQFMSDTLTIGTNVLINAGGTPPWKHADIFVAKYDSGGNFLWAKSAGGIDSDKSADISTDANGNVLVTGDFISPSITFGTTVLTNVVTNTPDMFIVKYDASGNVLWAQSVGPGALGYGICSASGGNVLVTGLGGTMTFGPSVSISTSAGGGDIFIVQYDASGNALWVQSAGGSGTDDGFHICTDIAGNILIGGIFYSPSIAFGTTVLINAGGYPTSWPYPDMFVAKLDNTGFTGIAEENHTPDPVTVFPNPSNGQFNFACSANMDEIKIFNLTGQIIYRSKPHEKSISLQFDKAGIYFIQVTMKDQTVTKKIIVSR